MRRQQGQESRECATSLSGRGCWEELNKSTRNIQTHNGGLSAETKHNNMMLLLSQYPAPLAQNGLLAVRASAPS
jgi:hypothetical protein